MKKHLQHLILITTGIVFSLLIAEGILRALIYSNLIHYPQPDLRITLHQYSNNSELLYELKPSAHVKHKGTILETNKYGMRDYEYTLNKPSGTRRICVLGDSIAFSHDLPINENFENILELKLNNTNNKSSKYEVLNMSVIGYNSHQEEIVLKEKALKFSPDLILVGLCLNDNSSTDGLRDLSKAMSPHSLGSRLHSKLISYVHYIWEMNGPTTIDNNRVDHFFQELSLLEKKNNLKTVILVFPFYFKDIKEYAQPMHQFVNKLSQKYGLNTIDFKDSWKDMSSQDRKALYLPDDHTHLSAIGMQKVADELFEYFIKNPIQ